MISSHLSGKQLFNDVYARVMQNDEMSENPYICDFVFGFKDYTISSLSQTINWLKIR